MWWPFKKKPVHTKTPRYVHKSQVIPNLPSRSKAKRKLKKVLNALIKSTDYYKNQLEYVRDTKPILDDKDHREFLIKYVREQRKLLDVVESCLILALSDAGHVDLKGPVRAYVSRVLEEYLRDHG